jgi:glutathione S-transferase
MPDYKLTYFDFDGGRGEPVRIALHAAGVPFEDERVTFPQFQEAREGLRFRALPVMYIDGGEVTQSNAMSRYVGKMAGLYPEDGLQALYCDEAMEAVEDLSHHIVRTFGLEGDALREAREALVDGWMSVFVKGLGDLLTRGGGEYFADGRLTVADLKVFVTTRWLCSGGLDHVPRDLVERLAPGLIAHEQRVAGHDIVAAYYASRG